MKDYQLGLSIFLLLLSFQSFSQNTVGLLSYNTEKAYDSYNLVFPHNQSTVFLIDNCGQIVHSWTDEPDFRPGNSVYLLENGNLVKCKRGNTTVNSPIWAGGGGQIVEVRSWENELLYQFERNDSIYRLHHDVAPMPNGNILMIAWELKNLDEVIRAGRDTSQLQRPEVWSEVIWEWDPFQDSIVWEWHAWDHLVQDYRPNLANFDQISNRPERINVNYDEHAGHPDWLHINSIDYNPILDQIVLSVPYFNELWVIDHSTSTAEAASTTGGLQGRGGDLIYRYGNPAAYNAGNLEDKRFFFQHDIHWVRPEATPQDADYGVMTLFNNRVSDNISTMDILASLDENGEYTFDNGRWGPEGFTQTIMHPDTISIAHSSSLSSAQYLPNGNALLLAGRWGYAYEISPSQEIVWEYRIPVRAGQAVDQGADLSINNNITFRLKKYDRTYPAFTNRLLSPQGYWEINPNVSVCPLTVSLTELDKTPTRFKLFPNPASAEITLKALDKTAGPIALYNVSGKLLRLIKVEAETMILNIDDLASGMYIIKHAQQAQKLIIR